MTERSVREVSMPQSFSDLFEESNRAFLGFLQAELRLGLTFAGMAQGYRGKGNEERYETNKRYTMQAMATIDQLKGRLSDTAREGLQRDSVSFAAIIATL